MTVHSYCVRLVRFAAADAFAGRVCMMALSDAGLIP
jgi:hypothetical protein